MKGLRLLTVLCMLTMGIAAYDAFTARTVDHDFLYPASTEPHIFFHASPLPEPWLVVIDEPTGDHTGVGTRVAEWCKELGGCPSPIKIRIREPRDMPSGAMAFTTRTDGDDNGIGCDLHFTQETVRIDVVIAHEVCHCVKERDVMTGLGYRFGTPRDEIDLREQRAERCAERLTRR